MKRSAKLSPKRIEDARRLLDYLEIEQDSLTDEQAVEVAANEAEAERRSMELLYRQKSSS